jgi:hypothetical protein
MANLAVAGRVNPVLHRERNFPFAQLWQDFRSNSHHGINVEIALPGTAMSSFVAGLKYFYLSCLSRPASDRSLYRAIRRNRVQKILEIGIGPAQRARRMIGLAERCSPNARIHYTGIDLFEARDASSATGLTLKEAYRQLKATSARVRLAPGDPLSALSRIANVLIGTDLIIISAGVDESSLSQAWRFVPRMLHPGSQIYVQHGPTSEAPFQLLTAAELADLAAPRTLRRAA